jgi:hypothetical protein
VSQMLRRGSLPEPDAKISDRYGWTPATIIAWEGNSSRQRKGKR